MPNQKWDDATVASVLTHLVRFMGMPSIRWEDFGDQVDIPGYKLRYAWLLQVLNDMLIVDNPGPSFIP